MYKRNYLVVWKGDGDVVQSSVTTSLDPHSVTEEQWILMAAESEGGDEGVLEITPTLFLVIDEPTEYYV